MWQRVKKILKIIFYPLLLVVGLIAGRLLAGGRGKSDGSAAYERAQGDLDSAKQSAARVSELLDGFESSLGRVREQAELSTEQLCSLISENAECRDELRSLGQQIDRAREAGAGCQAILDEYNRLSDRSIVLIDELIRRIPSGNGKSEKTEHPVDRPDGGDSGAGSDGSGD